MSQPQLVVRCVTSSGPLLISHPQSLEPPALLTQTFQYCSCSGRIFRNIPPKIEHWLLLYIHKQAPRMSRIAQERTEMVEPPAAFPFLGVIALLFPPRANGFENSSQAAADPFSCFLVSRHLLVGGLKVTQDSHLPRSATITSNLYRESAALVRNPSPEMLLPSCSM